MKVYDELIISNFRSWKGDHYLELRNINLLFGANSTGKSSIIHALSLLKQSQLGSRLIAKSSEIDLGKIKDQINKTALKSNRSGSKDLLKFGIRINDLSAWARGNNSYANLNPRRTQLEGLSSRRQLREKSFTKMQVELNYLDYLEGYDELGNISSIALNCIHGQVLEVQFERTKKNNSFKVKITENEDIWNAFVDWEAQTNRISSGNFSEKISDLQSHLIKLLEHKKSIRKEAREFESRKKDLGIEMQYSRSGGFDILMQQQEQIELEIIKVQRQISETRMEKQKAISILEDKVLELQTKIETIEGKKSQFREVMKELQVNLDSFQKQNNDQEVTSIRKRLDQSEQIFKQADAKFKTLSLELNEATNRLASMQMKLPGNNKKEKIQKLTKSLSFKINDTDGEKQGLKRLEELIVVSLQASRRSRAGLSAWSLKKFEGLENAIEAESTLSESCLIPGLTPINLLLFASQHFQRLVSSVQRIGPHRNRPERLAFLNATDKKNEVGSAGENVMSIIHRIDDAQMVELNNWFTMMEIPYSVDKQFNEDFEIAQLILIDKNDQRISITDVGYGVGQVLPVILTSMLLTNSLIVIEQPELHLHPKLQANLANLFIKSSKERNNVFILETHSEHMVLRLKRLQQQNSVLGFNLSNVNRNRTSKNRQPPLAPLWKDISISVGISVVELDGNPKSSIISLVSFNDDGDFNTPWPGGFFPERYVELGFED